MSENIKVSVVLPVYNVERYLIKCMDDILGQTLKEIEVICIDDGSTDRSLDILRQFEKKDNRVKVLSQKNAGAAAARNKGMDLSRGEYISFLDSDDFFEPEMLENAYVAAKQQKVDIVIFSGDRYDDTLEKYIQMDYSIKKKQLPNKNPFNWEDIPEHIFTFAVGWAWDKLYRSDFVKDENLRFQKVRTSNDLFFVFTSLVKATRIYTMEELLVHHRIHVKDSLSVTREKSWKCFYEAALALKEELIKMDVYARVEKGFINWALHFCFWNLDTIEGGIAYEKVYDLICRECCKQFYFLKHERGYYAQPELYDRLLSMKEISCVEYLLQENAQLTERKSIAELQTKRLKSEIDKIKASATFRTGKIVTALPRRMKKIFKGEDHA